MTEPVLEPAAQTFVEAPRRDAVVLGPVHDRPRAPIAFLPGVLARR
ncbi:hypothetical protein [Thermomonospora amylolytica]|nr:hypothetical protein [Thermomonospora amylolytica]